MKVYFATFFCTISLFLCALQKAPLNKSDLSKNAFISSRVIDEKGNPLGNAQIEIFDDSTNQVISTSQSDTSGHFEVSIPSGKMYVLVISKSGYLFQFINIAIPDSSGYREDLKEITLQKIEVEKKIILNSFPIESTSIVRKKSILELERIVKLINDNTSLLIEISGYTDNVGTEDSNQLFSEQRAKAIVDKLISKGCDSKRISYKGYGSSEPIADNNTKNGRQVNNRIELRIIKVDGAEKPKENENLNKEDNKVDLAANQALQARNPLKSMKKDSTAATDTTNLVLKQTENDELDEGVKTQDKKVDLASKQAEQDIALTKLMQKDSTEAANKAALAAKQAMRDKEVKDSTETAHKADLAAKQAEQDKALVILMQKDSTEAADKGILAAKQVVRDKEVKDSTETADKAILTAKQAVRDKEVKDSTETADKAALVAKQAIRDKEVKDSTETADKAALAAKQAEQEKQTKDSIAAAQIAHIAAEKAEQEKALATLMQKDSTEAADKAVLVAKQAEQDRLTRDSIAAAQIVHIAAEKAEQDKVLATLMQKDSTEAAEKTALSAKQAEQDKQTKDSIASAQIARIAAEKTEQDKVLATLMQKDSTEAAEKTALSAKQAEQEKQTRDSIANAQKINIAADKAALVKGQVEQEKERKDSIATAHKVTLAIQAEQRKQVRDSISAVHKADLIAKQEKQNENKGNAGKTAEGNLVQHDYIYHSALKEDESIDSTGAEQSKKNKDTTLAVVKPTESINSSHIEVRRENKDTALTIVKQAETIDSSRAEVHHENKDTALIIGKKSEYVDSTEVISSQENKDTAAVIVNLGEGIDSTDVLPNQGNKNIAATIAKTSESEIPSTHSLKMEIKNMGQQLNTPFDEYTPLVSADGHMMIFTSRRPSTKKEIQKGKAGLEKVYVTYYDDKNENWLEPKLLGSSINLPDMNNSAVALSNDGQHMLMYHEGSDLNSNGEIFESQLYTDEWSEPVKLPPHINSEDNETCANLSPDGKTIYFVSDRIGGLGGKDIWYSTLDQNGKWSEAINMGPNINTAEDEESIFIHPNGNTIFFSSKGHNSMGGYDIFMSIFDDVTKKWAPAENLGAPINTPDDDISFFLEANGKTGYYASSKAGGLGGLDIYHVTFFEDIMKTNIALLQGRVTNKNGNYVGATILVKDMSSGKLSEPIKSNKTNGQYFVSLSPGKKYEITVTAYGYNSYTEPFEIPYKAVSEEVIKNIVLESKNAFISSRVVDEKGSPIGGVLVEMVDKATHLVIAKPKTNSAGYSIISVPFGKEYEVVFSRPGYLFKSVFASIPDSVGYLKDLKDITLPRAEVGKKVVLSSIYFDAYKPVIKKESNLELERVIRLMNEMTSLQVEISGFTDNVGTVLYKKELSEKKAREVMSNIIILGGDKNRLKFMGYGPDQPIALNFTEDGRKQNNRIELKVLKVDLAAEQIAEVKRMKEINAASDKEEEAPKESFELSTDSIKMEVKNIGKQINTPFADYAPIVSTDGHTMIFTSKRPTTQKDIKEGKEGLDNIYVTYYDDKIDKWIEPKILGPTVNLPHTHNSALLLPNDGQQMLVYHSEEEIHATGDIYEHLLYGKEYCIPVRALPKPINSDYNETSVGISPDGKTFYFVSDRKGGFGGKDIWYTKQDEDGVYGEAVNMGPSINTAADEESVFIHPYGNVIFFSSKGHNSMGGFDIFMSVFDESSQTWMEPENLGLPVNSYGDDVYFTLSANGKIGYYASSKSGGQGGLDIYSVEFSEDIIKKNTTLLKGHVFNKNKRPVKAIIVVKNKVTDKIIDIIKSNRATGEYYIPVVSGTRVEVEYNAYGYNPYKVAFDVPFKSGSQKIIKDVVLETNSGFVASSVMDEKGKPLSGVQLNIVDNITNSVIANSLSDSTGFTMTAVPLGSIYTVVISKPGYLIQSYNVEIPDSVGYEKYLKNILLQKLETGKKIVLNTVQFDLNQTKIHTESITELKQVVKLMNEDVSLQFEISGYADEVGKNNQILSEQRAKIVVDSIIRNGGDRKRLKYKGFGSTQPIGNNTTEEGRRLNNRIELKVLKGDEKAGENPTKGNASVKKGNKEPVNTDNKPLAERLKKYDKDHNGIISYEELLAAMDSTKTEIDKRQKPEATTEKRTEEKISKDATISPVKKDESINSIEEEDGQEKNDSVSITHKVSLTAMQAEQEKELVKLMNKDSIATAEKADLAAKQAEQDKAEKDSVAAAHKASLTAMQAEQEKELIKLMNKDSVAAADKANLATKQAEQEKAVKDSIATAAKKDESVNPFKNPYKKEQVQENKDTAVVEKEETPEQKEKTVKVILPENFKVYDTDNDGILSYNEILSVIDTFLDKAPDPKDDPKMVKLISEMIDFFFDQ